MDFYTLRQSILEGELWTDNPDFLPIKFKGGVWVFPTLQASRFVKKVMINDFIPDKAKGIALLSFSAEDQGFLASLWPSPKEDHAEYLVPLVILAEIEKGALLQDRTLRTMILRQTRRLRPDVYDHIP